MLKENNNNNNVNDIGDGKTQLNEDYSNKLLIIKEGGEGMNETRKVLYSWMSWFRLEFVQYHFSNCHFSKRGHLSVQFEFIIINMMN